MFYVFIFGGFGGLEEVVVVVWYDFGFYGVVRVWMVLDGFGIDMLNCGIYYFVGFLERVCFCVFV